MTAIAPSTPRALFMLLDSTFRTDHGTQSHLVGGVWVHLPSSPTSGARGWWGCLFPNFLGGGFRTNASILED